MLRKDDGTTGLKTRSVVMRWRLSRICSRMDERACGDLGVCKKSCAVFREAEASQFVSASDIYRPSIGFCTSVTHEHILDSMLTFARARRG